MSYWRWNFEDDEIRPYEPKHTDDLFRHDRLKAYGIDGWKLISSDNYFVRCYIRDHRMLLLAECDNAQQAREYMLSYVQFCIRHTSDIAELGVA